MIKIRGVQIRFTDRLFCDSGSDRSRNIYVRCSSNQRRCYCINVIPKHLEATIAKLVKSDVKWKNLTMQYVFVQRDLSRTHVKTFRIRDFLRICSRRSL